MTTPADKNAAGILGGIATGHAQHKTDARLGAEADRGRTVALVDAWSIAHRADDTRPARAEHVLAIAESIAAVGLVQPLAVDKHHRLIAGLHRLHACLLLLTPPKGREDAFALLTDAPKVENAEDRLAALPAPSKLLEPLRGEKIPCRVFTDLDAEKDANAALAAEAAENTARRQYTAPEVEAVVARLKKAGYRELKGRPKKGQKALRPALQTVLGISPRQATNVLKKDATGKASNVATFSAALPKLAKVLDALEAPDIPTGTRAPALRRALELATELEALLPEATREAKDLDA